MWRLNGVLVKNHYLKIFIQTCIIYDEFTTFNLSFEDPFPPELSEKINLINSEFKEEGSIGFLFGQVDVNGDEGYYSLSVELNRKGVVLNSHFQMKDN